MGKATEDGDKVDYFKSLFGNLAKGSLSLFSDKNPFHRKREEGKTKHIAENDESLGPKKKKEVKNVEANKKIGLEAKNEAASENVDNLDLRTKKKKSQNENDANLDLGKKKKSSGNGNDEGGTSNGDGTGKKKKKKKSQDDENSNNLRQEKSKHETASENDEKLDLRTRRKESYSENLKFGKKKKVDGVKEEAGTNSDDGAGEKKKKKVSEESSDGEGNIGSHVDEQANLSFETQRRYDTHDLLERKRDMPEDLAESRKQKKKKITVEENSHFALGVHSNPVQEVPRAKQLKRALVLEGNEPNKRIKTHHQHYHNFEVGAEMSLASIAKMKEKSVTELKGKSELGKRKRDVIEEEYEARHALGGSANPSKEVAIPEKLTGKRKRGDDEADMVVMNQDFDDREKLERTIFVGNLPLGVKRKKLIREFAQFGEVETIRLRSVPLVDTNLPRKGAILKGQVNDSIDSVHAYIVFKDAQSANAALSHNMTEFGGKHIRVDRAHPPRKKLKGENHLIYDTKRTVFVGNLPFDVKDEELYRLFVGITPSETGVEAIRVIRDSQTSMGKGIAYVLFKTVDAAKLAVREKDLKLRDRSLRLCRARSASNTGPHVASTPRLKSGTSPSAKTLGRKRFADSEETSIIPLKKKSKSSLSYQGTKASKTDRHPINLTGSMSKDGNIKKSYNPQTSEPRPRMVKRPAVAARRAMPSQSPGQNLAGKKRKGAERTGYSKPSKKHRASQQ